MPEDPNLSAIARDMLEEIDGMCKPDCAEEYFRARQAIVLAALKRAQDEAYEKVAWAVDCGDGCECEGVCKRELAEGIRALKSGAPDNAD